MSPQARVQSSRGVALSLQHVVHGPVETACDAFEQERHIDEKQAVLRPDDRSLLEGDEVPVGTRRAEPRLERVRRPRDEVEKSVPPLLRHRRVEPRVKKNRLPGLPASGMRPDGERHADEILDIEPCCPVQQGRGIDPTVRLRQMAVVPPEPDCAIENRRNVVRYVERLVDHQLNRGTVREAPHRLVGVGGIDVAFRSDRVREQRRANYGWAWQRKPGRRRTREHFAERCRGSLVALSTARPFATAALSRATTGSASTLRISASNVSTRSGRSMMRGQDTETDEECVAVGIVVHQPAHRTVEDVRRYSSPTAVEVVVEREVHLGVVNRSRPGASGNCQPAARDPDRADSSCARTGPNRNTLLDRNQRLAEPRRQGAWRPRTSS